MTIIMNLNNDDEILFEYITWIKFVQLLISLHHSQLSFV